VEFDCIIADKEKKKVQNTFLMNLSHLQVAFCVNAIFHSFLTFFYGAGMLDNYG